MTKDASWYGINMLPLYVEMSDGQLESSREQLKILQKAQFQPDFFDDATLHRIIKIRSSQNADIWVFFEQCTRWRNNCCQDEELKLIAQVEKNIHELERVNHEILSLASILKGKRVDKVPVKDSLALGLDFLLKKRTNPHSD